MCVFINKINKKWLFLTCPEYRVRELPAVRNTVTAFHSLDIESNVNFILESSKLSGPKCVNRTLEYTSDPSTEAERPIRLFPFLKSNRTWSVRSLGACLEYRECVLPSPLQFFSKRSTKTSIWPWIQGKRALKYLKGMRMPAARGENICKTGQEKKLKARVSMQAAAATFLPMCRCWIGFQPLSNSQGRIPTSQSGNVNHPIVKLCQHKWTSQC